MTKINYDKGVKRNQVRTNELKRCLKLQEAAESWEIQRKAGDRNNRDHLSLSDSLELTVCNRRKFKHVWRTHPLTQPISDKIRVQFFLWLPLPSYKGEKDPKEEAVFTIMNNIIGMKRNQLMNKISHKQLLCIMYEIKKTDERIRAAVH